VWAGALGLVGLCPALVIPLAAFEFLRLVVDDARV
jgi:hypothetical protein